MVVALHCNPQLWQIQLCQCVHCPLFLYDTLSGSVRKVHSATDTRLHIQTDPAVEQSAKNLHEVQRLVHSQWDDDNHGLEGGEFVKGTKKEGVKTSLDPKTGNQWLVFGGGQREKSGGLVDAFTGRPALLLTQGNSRICT